MLAFIKKLRESDEAAKIKWLVLFSTVAMIAVIFIWLKYFNSIVRPINEQRQAEQEQVAGQNFAFWQTFKAGLGVVFQSITDGFHSIFNAIREPKSYIVKP